MKKLKQLNFEIGKFEYYATTQYCGVRKYFKMSLKSWILEKQTSNRVFFKAIKRAVLNFSLKI